MNILLSIHHPISIEGGAPGVTKQLAGAFSRQGHDVTVLSFEVIPRRFQGKAAQLVFPWVVARHIDRQAREYDIMDLSSGDGCRLNSENYKRSLIVFRSHGLEHASAEQTRAAARRGELKLSWKYPLYHGGWRLHEVARSLRLADLGLLLSQRDLDYAVSRLKVDPSRCEIVPNGLPPAFLQQPLSVVPDANNPLRVAMIGGYLHRKGFPYAIGALSRLFARYSLLEVGFLGVGKGNASRIEEELGEAGRGRVNIVESYAHEELPKLLQNYHVLLFPSLSEGFPLAALEGMACGLALITTSTGGLAERLRDRHDAMIIPPANEAGIEHAIEALLNDRFLLQRVREAGQAKAQSFSWDSIARDQLALYAQRLEEKCKCSDFRSR
ncbi:glycosyltransferase family 4 protein [Acidithiobacillus thiooxidans]|uniref:glycosyltransferase family 4 protein n=1 Tax=Acidithiobacillus thiooxidans TaxID=930 RepID=UPI0002624D68|nr:glycosyltransferase family 4 protein [Acidithiobacillus thiooxidans]MBU2812599.1 glycosyltransferase family 4 protein [Acidithiobacillus thiooxidans]